MAGQTRQDGPPVDATKSQHRFQFSLATLLIAMAWSGVAVWMNTREHVERLHIPDHDALKLCNVYRGWPWAYTRAVGDVGLGGDRPGNAENVGWWPWKLAGDAVVGVLFVAMLTWGSSQLLRRVGARLRRRKAVEEQT
ncbi:MAG: hypothetical protein NTY19_03950 [Planctomycetota bacterium]|nr:hypothetical protein [Planctomycetota bacterium]